MFEVFVCHIFCNASQEEVSWFVVAFSSFTFGGLTSLEGKGKTINDFRSKKLKKNYQKTNSTVPVQEFKIKGIEEENISKDFSSKNFYDRVGFVVVFCPCIQCKYHFNTV